jgi:phosphohistidine phosphatase
MGGVCGDTLPPPDLVLVSSALRTRETIDLFLEGWGLTDTRVIVEEDLYLAGIADWRSVVSQWADEADHILGCAHQPGLGDFAGWLDSSCTQEVPTAAVFSFSITGGELKRSCGRMDLYRIPRDFR